MVEDTIRSLTLRMKSPSIRYYAAAVGIVQYYIPGHILIDENDVFLKLNPPRPQDSNWEYLARVVQLGGILFSLRNQPGIAEICRRLGTRNLKQAYSELASAGVLLQLDFDVEARRETGVATQDFDFTVSRNGERINVEVWQCETVDFNPRSLLRRLQDKRKQLPDNAPALIICVFPESWYDHVEKLQHEFTVICERFFGSTRRINVVIFVHEEFIDDGTSGAGYLGINAYPVTHHNPRFPNEYLNKALEAGPAAHRIIEDLIDVPKTVHSKYSHDEFHRWVNWIIDGSA